jgi:hypothetical protein
MANVPSNSTAVTVLQGQSITGSFAGFIPCTNTINNYADFRGLKDANGAELCTSGSTPALYFKEGQVYPIFITSASLHASSANVVFFT